MTKTYLKDSFRCDMADYFCCVRCEEWFNDKPNRQVLRKNGGINYVCMNCYKEEKK